MKNHLSPPAEAADTDAGIVIPVDFPVPDEILELFEEAACASGIDIDERGFAIEFCSGAYFSRYGMCKELALQLCSIIEASGLPAATSMHRHALLERYRLALTATAWTSPEEAFWIAHRMALWMGWSEALPVTGTLH